MVIAGRPGIRDGGGDGEHRVYHQVHGNDVHDPLGDGRKLGNRAPAVGEDDGLGHLEALDPPRVRGGERAFHDGRTDDRKWKPDLARQLFGGPLAESLAEGVDVGPPERLGPGPAVLDEALAHPVAAALLGSGRHLLWARPAVLSLCRSYEV